MVKINICAADAGQRMDKLIRRLLPKAPSSFIYKMLRKKNIVLNGKKAEGNEILKNGDVILMYLSDDTIAHFGGRTHPSLSDHSDNRDDWNKKKKQASFAYIELGKQYPGLRILFEDHDIAAAYKPKGILSQKVKETDFSLNEWFLGYLLTTKEISEENLSLYPPSTQNRLDKETEGIVLLSKTLQGSQYLTRYQRQRSIKKWYDMIVVGHVDGEGSVTGWLTRTWQDNTVTFSNEKVNDHSVYSRTLYRPVTWSKNRKFTLVEAKLVTGRTHQLRVHMAAIGHPIAGDPKYGNTKVNQMLQKEGISSQMLICKKVEFPKTDHEFFDLSQKIIEVPLPSSFMQLLS